MAFQSTIAVAQGYGVIGESQFSGPRRAQPGVVKGTAANIVVGRAFTIDAADGQFQPGGSGAYGGILSNPKALQSIGTSAGGPLAPTLVVPAGTVGEFATLDELLVLLAGACAIGDKVAFKISDGTLAAYPAQSTYSGVIAVTSGILTVSSASAGANLAVGSPVIGTGVPGGTFITALGTGTGGNGTYQTNIVTAVSAFTDGVVDNAAPAAHTEIKGARVQRFANAAAGLAVVSLTGPL